jgi:hypothetical protein
MRMNNSISAMAVICLFLYANVKASPSPHVLDITPVTQDLGSNWCWAACCEMVLDYYDIEVRLKSTLFF